MDIEESDSSEKDSPTRETKIESNQKEKLDPKQNEPSKYIKKSIS